MYYFTPLSSHLSSVANMFTLLSSKECFFTFKCKQTAESQPEELALKYVEAALDCINYITLFMPGSVPHIV